MNTTKFDSPPDLRAGPQRSLLIVGGGIAGLELATALGRWRRRLGARAANVPDITLVDRDFAHVWKPMLHTIAAGTRDIHQQQTSYIAQARAAGFRYEPGELCGVHRGSRIAHLAAMHAEDGRLLIPARRLHYDTLIVAVGSRANDFGTPGVAAHCHTIDSRQQADAFGQEVRLRLLQCMAHGGVPGVPGTLSIAIVGGGATGVELAAELTGLAASAEAYGAHGLATRVRITLIESAPRLLAAFPQDISSGVQARLEALGVRVRTATRVAAATTNGFLLADGSEVGASLRVWAAGVKAPDFLAGLDGLETNRSHQLLVRPSLQTTLDDHIYAVGDCCSLVYASADRPLPPTAQVAHQQAQHLIRHLPAALLSGATVPDFRHTDMGALVSLGDYDAFGALGKTGLFKGVTFKGRLAQYSHEWLYRSHQARLHGFWRGSLLWFVDMLNSRLRATIRLD
ncbi:NAD(P)/FAD-dependent oxidoreductase [Janthinobacterium aquaticum]|uniref:NAD(P)/FAD-dependent oxidoreductase n=1 Tax=Janthinobacterium sp. FT58W TaxID=2654254 RepID=UPI001264F4E9|nr:FAD-dependent oxidoreductase [Janthinobacterium sp. FT58W]KAB8035782.1 NAD(P)/FAD-dependent oxidoreductase [Janthinobacterium sp. FT58W]